MISNTGLEIDTPPPPPPGETDSIRCCVTGKELEYYEDYGAVPIISLGSGTNNAKYIFGEPAYPKIGHLLSTRNGLVMSDLAAVSWGRGRFSIVPTFGHGAKEEPRWKVLVLEDGWELPLLFPGCTMPLQDKVLEFQSNFRPDRRYLYLAHLCRIFINQRYEPAGWRRKFSSTLRLKAWGIPLGQFLRVSALIVLGRRMCYMEPSEVAEMIGVGHGETEHEIGAMTSWTGSETTPLKKPNYSATLSTSA